VSVECLPSSTRFSLEDSRSDVPSVGAEDGVAIELVENAAARPRVRQVIKPSSPNRSTRGRTPRSLIEEELREKEKEAG